jgi:hypothetical protein
MAGYDRRMRTQNPEEGLAARIDSDDNPDFPPAAAGSETGDVEAQRQVIAAQRGEQDTTASNSPPGVPGVRSRD